MPVPAAPRRRTRGLTAILLLAGGALLALAALFAPTAQDDRGHADPVSELAWMSGTWRSTGDGQFLEEIWSDPIATDTLMGMFRWVRTLGGTWMYELMSIENEPGGDVVFRIRHFSRGLEPWKSEADGVGRYVLVSNEGQEAVFENPDSVDPRQFIYSRDDEVLTVALVGVDAEGRPDREHADSFQFRLHTD